MTGGAVRVGLQRGTLCPDLNLSLGFAERIAHLSEELANDFRKCDHDENDSNGIVEWLRLVDVDPVQVAERIATPPPDPACGWFTALAALETELSAQQMKRMFFVRPE